MQSVRQPVTRNQRSTERKCWLQLRPGVKQRAELSVYQASISTIQRHTHTHQCMTYSWKHTPTLSALSGGLIVTAGNNLLTLQVTDRAPTVPPLLHTDPSRHLPLSEENGSEGGHHTSGHPETLCVKADRRKVART